MHFEFYKNQFLLTTIFFGLFSKATSVQELRIGGIFDQRETFQDVAFRLVVSSINGQNAFSGLRFIPNTATVDTDDPLQVSRTLCLMLEAGVVGIFGPNSHKSSVYTQSLCDRKEMPHVEVNWNWHNKRSNCLVNLHPHPQVLSQVFVDLIDAWNWRRFTIIYQDNNSLLRVSKLLNMAETRKGIRIALCQLDLDETGSYRTVLSTIKKSKEVNFVLDCSIDILNEVLHQAQQVGLVTDLQQYIITNLDTHTLDLSPYQYGGCNITGVRLIDPEHSSIIAFAENLQSYKQKMNAKSVQHHVPGHLAAWKLSAVTALVHDAVSLFFETLKDLKLKKQIEMKRLPCNSTLNWEHGYSIINFMKTLTLHDGLTGKVKFDQEGYRSDFILDVVELTSGGLIKIGTWNSTEGLNLTRIQAATQVVTPDENSLQNKSFIVITALTPPYGMLKETPIQLNGNDRFEGFGIDLIHELSLMLGFNYTFVIQEDGANGNYNREKHEWNGMIREIFDGRADLAITDLTITSEREEAVDFTMPFMNLGISILYRKPKPVPPSLFTFASPFSPQVWGLLGVAYFFVSISLFLMARLCPAEWTNPYPCIDDPDFYVNQFSLRNSFWYTIGSLMQQGTELAPIGISTRMVAGIWWFFTLIMVSSYTANLAAFLTVETLVTSFKNIDELAEQTEISYGAKADGATSNFFRDSDLESYKTIWRYMFKHPDANTADNDEGVRRVEKENYAFLMESTSIEYIVERHCTLAQVGGLLDDKGYGIAMRKDSKYRNILSAAVLKLQENSILTALKIKWWKEKRGGGNCASRTAGGAATPLGLKNVEGVFLILVVGTILAFFGTFLELAMHILRQTYNTTISFKEEYKEELKFFIKFKGKLKPTRSGTRNSPNPSEVSKLMNIENGESSRNK